jgi:glycerophosphoryl diester phosphodiesterase
VHPFFSSPRPLVFAHRGGAALAPENTIDAFDNGLALGADGIELDVRASRDHEIIVHHDPTLDRTTRLQGPVALRNTDELARAGVPMLSEILARYRDTRIIIELKLDDAAFAAAVVERIRAAGAVDRVCIGSFGWSALGAVRRIEPSLATSAARGEARWALYRSWCRLPISRAAYDGYQVPEYWGRTRVVSPRFVADAHRGGFGVQVWTVDTAEDAGRLIGWGADALITDRPDLIVPLVRPGCPEDPREVPTAR